MLMLGNRMWKLMLAPNWMRASSSGSSVSIVAPKCRLSRGTWQSVQRNPQLRAAPADRRQTGHRRPRSEELAMSFKRILVSTDRSELSHKAIHAAIELAQESGARLVAVTVIE